MHLRRQQQNIRRNRIFRDPDNPLDYLDDTEIVRKYRLSRPMIIDICRMFEFDLQRPTRRSRAFPVSLQVMVALRFFATGSFQLVNADVHNISISSVSRISRDGTVCLKRVCNHNIKMPTDRAQLHNMMEGFYSIDDFPNIVGAIDGTHIRITSPLEDEHLYVNRKNYHSINVQGVCDSNMKFLNIVAKWPGSTHDAFIWANSSLSEMFEDGTIDHGWLIGDSGYSLRPWLLTPVLNPTTRNQQRYNASHMKTRSVVERSFGVLKSRFCCIDASAGTLLYKPFKCCDIFIAVAVLNNMCIANRIPLPADIDGNRPDQGHIDRQQYVGHLNDGANVRNRLINGRLGH
ncbi:HARBI1 [Mytilus coruscus]|uniref:Putative nuclease HARBI1 n=1 Tax=Mytilus coruscus TaxID=42192 RepID=A0A6J8CV87_MYTCO|nr:HARBI1 [Mytilus coruscus]